MSKRCAKRFRVLNKKKYNSGNNSTYADSYMKNISMQSKSYPAIDLYLILFLKLS